jgi:hypothetical protein
LKIETGVKFDLCAVQSSTNDINFTLAPSAPLSEGFPRTDDELLHLLDGDAAKLGLSFGKKVALLGAGSSCHRVSKHARTAASLPLRSSYTPTEVHQLCHRMHILSLVRSYEENVDIAAGRTPDVVHTPMGFWPAATQQKDHLEKLGHVQSRFYGDLAVEMMNCIHHAFRKIDPEYEAEYLRCPGIPPSFSESYKLCWGAGLPSEQHRHLDDKNDCLGLCRVRARSSGGPKLEITWADHPNLVRVLYGETAPTAMYLG